MLEALLKIKDNCKNYHYCEGCPFHAVNKNDIMWGCLLLQDPCDWPIQEIVEAYEKIDDEE